MCTYAGHHWNQRMLATVHVVAYDRSMDRVPELEVATDKPLVFNADWHQKRLWQVQTSQFLHWLIMFIVKLSTI